jgi:hypothetical protein
LQQFETSLNSPSTENPLGLDLSFGYYHRNISKYNPGIPIRFHKCGLVYSASSVVLCWVDVSLESEDPECWTDFISVVGKRQGAVYLKNFLDREGTRCTQAEFFQKIENWFFRDLIPSDILYTSRNLYRFGRFKLQTESTLDALKFFYLSTGDSENYEALALMAEENAKNTNDIRWSWSMDAVSSVLQISSVHLQTKGAARFQNSFRFADSWLTYVISLTQYHLMIDMERDIVRTMMTMHQIRRKKSIFCALRRDSYEEVLRGNYGSFYGLILETWIDPDSFSCRETCFISWASDDFRLPRYGFSISHQTIHSWCFFAGEKKRSCRLVFDLCAFRFSSPWIAWN